MHSHAGARERKNQQSTIQRDERRTSNIERPILNDGVASLLNLGKQQPLNLEPLNLV